MLSREPIATVQRGQRERGRMMDSWRGRREMQTLRKLPNARPKRTAKMATSRVRCCLRYHCTEPAPVMDQLILHQGYNDLRGEQA